MLRLALADAAARAAIVAVSAALLHGGNRTCASLGWVAGLALLPLDPQARMLVAAGLAYGAAHSALLATAAPAIAGASAAGETGAGSSRALVFVVGDGLRDRECVGRLRGGMAVLFHPLFGEASGSALGVPSMAAPVAGALLLGASSAFLLGEYAKAAAGRPSLLQRPGAHALHFMLGFDGVTDAQSDREGQEEEEVEP
jgi:hypothetical protein